jgi:enoyl-CoA hydratase/carnithine racemase
MVNLMIQLEQHGSVFVAKMDRDEKSIDPAFIERFTAIVDEVALVVGPRALVTTGSDRFFSTGLSLSHIQTLDSKQLSAFLADVDRLLIRLVSAPFVTVAAINGHCIAAGGLLALAHDYRVMRIDQGFFSLPSIDVGIPFTRGMAALISTKVPPPWADDLAISGDRIGGHEALDRAIVHRAVPGDAVAASAVEIAERLSTKDADTLGTIKQRLYHDLLVALDS